MHHKLELSEDNKQITKYFTNHKLLKLELQRSIEASTICEKCDSIIVPKVIASDDNSITFTYFPNAITFADLLIQDFERAIDHAPALVDTLLYLQCNLTHPNKIRCSHYDSTPDYPGAFCHGDFSVNNLLLQDHSLILVDWSSSNWAGKQFNYAPKHWDLVWFILGLYLIPHIKELPFQRRDFIAKKLLNVYIKQGDISDPEIISSLALSQVAFFSNHNRQLSKWYSTLKHYPKWYRCRRFWKRELDERT